MTEQLPNRAPRWLFLSLFVCYVASIFFVHPVGDFPLNDDWVYARASVLTANAGSLTFTGYESAWVIPQVLVGGGIVSLFGPSHVLLRGVGMVSLLLLLLVFNAYLVRSRVDSFIRWVACALLASNPVVYLLSLSFMSDVPFLLLWTSACFMWELVLQGKRGLKSLVGAVVITVFAVAQRQFAVFIPVSVVFLILCRLRNVSAERANLQNCGLPMIGALVTLLATGCIHLWIRSQGGYQPPLLWGNPLAHLLENSFKMIAFLTLTFLPLLISILGSFNLERLRSRAVLFVSLVVLLCALTYIWKGESILIGNLLSEYGFHRPGEVLLGDRPKIIGKFLNGAAALLVATCFPFLLSQLLSSLYGKVFTRKGDQQFASVLVVSTVLYVALFVLRGGFDRYLLPAIPGLALVLAVSCERTTLLSRRLGLVVLLASSLFSFTLVHDYFRWNEVKWKAAMRLVGKGVAPEKIHAGYEWHGWYSGDSAPFPPALGPDYSHAISFSGPFAGWKVISRDKWSSIWPPRKRYMYVLRSTSPKD